MLFTGIFARSTGAGNWMPGHVIFDFLFFSSIIFIFHLELLGLTPRLIPAQARLWPFTKGAVPDRMADRPGWPAPSIRQHDRNKGEWA